MESRAGCPRSPRARSSSSARTCSAPARSRRAAPTCGSRLSDEEHAHGVVAASAATTPRAWRSPRRCSASRRRSSCPRARRSRRRGDPGRYGAEVIFHGRYLEDALAEAKAFSERTGAVLIHPSTTSTSWPGRVRRASRSSSRSPTCARSWCRPAAGAAGRHRDRGQGAAARRPGDRGAGRRRGGVPGLAERRAPGAADLDEHDGRRDRGRPAGQVTFAAVRDHVDDIVTVSEESLSRAVLAVLERAKMLVEPAGAARGGRVLDAPDRRSRPRRSPCSPAATSTRCCSAGDPARHGRRRPLSQPAGLHPRPARWPRPAALTEVGAVVRTCSRSPTSGSRPPAPPRGAGAPPARDRGEPHAQQVVARLRERGYRVYE